METWSDGYITDLPYTRHFFHDLSPALLRLVCVLNGVAPPDIDDGFDYCELGCGNGTTASIMAAAYPQGRFYCTDFNPTHIHYARNQAAELGLDNIHFHDDAFEEFMEKELPPFDFICLHGIYSWISPAQRRNIRTFISRHLKVGGVVYLSYNARPGQAAMDAIHRVLREVAAGETLEERLHNGFALLETLLAQPAGVFQAIPGIRNAITHLKSQQPGYLIHEFLNAYREAFYCTDIFAEMAEIKLTYAGSTDLSLNFDALGIPPAHLATAGGLKSIGQKQLLRDLLLNTAFRKDVYIRGPLRITPKEQATIYENIHIGRAPFCPGFRTTYRCPAGDVNMEKEKDAAALFQLLDEKSRTLQELANGAGGIAPAKMMACLSHLLASRQADVLARPEKNAKKTTTFNRRALDAITKELAPGWLASRVYGSGIFLSPLQALLIKGRLIKAGRGDICKKIAAGIAKRQGSITVDAVQLTEKEDMVRHLKEVYDGWMPLATREFRRLGLL